MNIDVIPKTWTVIFTIVNFLLLIMIIGISIYSFILLIKLGRRGIKALDIHNKKAEENK